MGKVLNNTFSVTANVTRMCVSAFSVLYISLRQAGLSSVVFSPEVVAEPGIYGNQHFLRVVPRRTPEGLGGTQKGRSPAGSDLTKAHGGRLCPSLRRR